MIVKFCTYQFIEPHKFLNVGSKEKIFLQKMTGLGNEHLKICVSWELNSILAKTRLKMQNFLTI